MCGGNAVAAVLLEMWVLISSHMPKSTLAYRANSPAVIERESPTYTGLHPRCLVVFFDRGSDDLVVMVVVVVLQVVMIFTSFLGRVNATKRL